MTHFAELLTGFFAVVLGVIVLVLPVWQSVRIFKLSRRLRELKDELDWLRMRWLEKDSPPPALPPVATPPAFPSPVFKPVVSAPPPPPSPVSKLPEVASAPQRVLKKGGAVAAVPASGLEILMGVRFLSWFGAVAAFFAVVFFLKYSISRGFFPPGVRATLGFVFGAGLLAGGVFASRRNYVVTGHALCACGVLSLYGVTFACRALYRFELFGLVPTFVVMSLVTVVAFVLAVRLRGKFIAVLGLFGGFMTPLLLGTALDSVPGLWGYVGLLDIGLCAVALWQRWNFLVLLGILGTVFVQMVWAFGGCHPADVIPVCLAFEGLFFVGYGVARVMGREAVVHSRGVVALALVSFVFAWFLWQSTLWEWGRGGVTTQGLWQTLVFLILAGVCVLAVAVFDRCERDVVRLPALVGAGMFIVLGSWMGPGVPVEVLLAGCFVFALLHMVFPLALARVRAVASGAVVPVCVMIALLLVPVCDLAKVAPGWPVVLAVLLVAAAIGQWWWCRRFGERAVASGCDLARAVMTSMPSFVLFAMMLEQNKSLASSLVFGGGLLLAVFALGLARVLRSEWLPVCALAGVALVCCEGFSQESPVAVFWIAGFCALFTTFPFVFRKVFSEARGAWFASALAGVVLFPFLREEVRSHLPDDAGMGFVPALLAAVAFACLVAVARFEAPENPRRAGRVALFGGVALLFVTLIFPMQFGRQWLTIAWALEGVALLGLNVRVAHRALPWAGVGLLATAFVRLALNPAVLSYHVRGEVPILNWYLYTYGVVAVCLFAGAWLLGVGRRDRFTGVAARVLPPLGAITAFLLLNIEIADFFAEPGSRALALRFSGNFARDMIYTIAWALFALALLVAGIWKHSRAARYAALGLFGVVALKLVFHDLAGLAALYRSGAFLAVAVVMSLASFLYQKYLVPRG
jgi:uncharacterized membrane protein